MARDADAWYMPLQRSTTSLIPSAAMQPSHYVPPCPVRTLVPSSAAMQQLFCYSSFHQHQCSLCSVTHRTICRNAVVTLCPSLSFSYPRTISCRIAAIVLSLIVQSAAMQPSRYVPPCPVLTLVPSSAAMQPLFCHSLTICRNAAVSRSQCSFVYSDAVPRVCIWTCVDLFCRGVAFALHRGTKSKQYKLS
jgi:hypothetical protein